VTACLTWLASQVLLRQPKGWKSLDPILPARVVTAYNTIPWRSWATLPTVLTLLPVVDFFLD